MKECGIVSILAVVTLLVFTNPVNASTLDETFCINIGGSWDTNTCSIGVDPGFPITMEIPAGAKFVVNGPISNTPMTIQINNGGIFNVNSSIGPTANLIIDNNGTVNINGHIECDNSVFNKKYGVINIHGTLDGIYTLVNSGTINIYGKLLNYGGNMNGGTINNNGIFDTLSAVEFVNDGLINNYDTFKNGAINNQGTITNFCGGTISNPGIISPKLVIYEAPCGGQSIPEFPTVALPVIAMMGLMFLLQRRKGK